jgi:glycosyltransferase involved in cell wall biosynthesis
LRRLDYDVLYLNSFFSHLCVQVLLLYQAGLIRETAVIIAPRGEFYPGALSIHSRRKRLYLWFIRRLGLTRNVTWQATSLAEKQLIMSLFGCTNTVKHLPDIWVGPALRPPLSGSLSPNGQKPAKEPGSARVIFLSRIARNKNLAMALTLLSQVSTGFVQFDIYGPTEDKQYWAECQQLSRGLPAHIAVNYRGPVDPDDVIEVFSRYHLFLFPTRGESFSFAILEALWAGCLVLTSDQTLWQNLEEKNAGWTLPLAEPERFVRVLETLVAMDDAQFEERSQAAQTLAQAVGADPTVIEANRQMFRLAASTFRDRS